MSFSFKGNLENKLNKKIVKPEDFFNVKINPCRRCYVCYGTGEVKKDKNYELCTKCEGEQCLNTYNDSKYTGPCNQHCGFLKKD
jgi:hypothetical protein